LATTILTPYFDKPSTSPKYALQGKDQVVTRVIYFWRNYVRSKTKLIFAWLICFPISVFAACVQRPPFDPGSVSVIGLSLTYSKSEGTSFVTTIGTIKNSSELLIEDLVVEVKYFNADQKLIDVVTQPVYGLVVPASQEVAFRIRDVADKPKAAYVSNTVRVISAEQRATQQSQPAQPSFSWSELLVSWGPMLLLIGVWIIFMRKMNKKGSPQVRTIELIERQNAILERIAAAAEKATSDMPS